MQFNTYTSSGAHIAAALVNDPMTEAAAVGALLAGFDVEEPVPGEAELLPQYQAEDRAAFAAVDATVHYHALQIQEFLRSGYYAMLSLRDQGVIRAFGAGVNCANVGF